MLLDSGEELEALKRGDLNAFAKFIAEEAVFVNAQGPGSKAQVVKNVADFKLLEFSMEDIRFVPVSEKSGLIAYKLIQRASSHGREFTTQVYASALWTKRDGKWICLFSQETGARPVRDQKSEIRGQLEQEAGADCRAPPAPAVWSCRLLPLTSDL